jgi:hypothetical protein
MAENRKQLYKKSPLLKKRSFLADDFNFIKLGVGPYFKSLSHTIFCETASFKRC